MTNEDRVVEAAKALSDDEKRRAAERILKLVTTYDPELEASLARGLADLRAGRVIDADDVIAELDVHRENGGLKTEVVGGSSSDVGCALR